MASNKLSILSFCHNMEVNGSNRFLYLLITHLVEQGHKITLVSPKHGPLNDDYVKLGVNILIHPIDSDDPLSLKHTEVGNCKYDVFFVNTIMRCDGVLLSCYLNTPSIWVIHETWPLEDIEHIMSKVWKWDWPKKKYIERAFKSAENIVYPALITKQCYKQQTIGKSVHTIYNGLDFNGINYLKKSLKRNEAKNDIGCDLEDFVFLQVGSINHRKNQKVSVEAVKLLRDTGERNVKLILLGARAIRGHEVKYIDEIEKYIDANDLSDIVSIHPVSKNVNKYYYASDVLLCPSLSEVLPYVIIEAMAFGVPSISTNIDGIPEAVIDGDTGWLIDSPSVEDLSEKMNHVYQNRFKLTNIKNNCVEYAYKNFSLDKNYMAYDSLLDEVVRKKNNQRAKR